MGLFASVGLLSVASVSIGWVISKMGLAPAVVQICLYCTCITATWFWHALQGSLSRLLPKHDRAPRRLESPRWLFVSDGSLQGLDKLPPITPASFDVLDVAFAGCANLSMYMYGVAYALQKSSGDRKVKWIASGGSSGAFVAAPFAMGVDCASCMMNAHGRFVKERQRFGGCIGLYSYSVGGIIREETRAAETSGSKPLEAVSGGSLAISVTRFNPWPVHAQITEFQSVEAVVQSVLASCYIPVAYEVPIVLPSLGFCIDGCVCNFLLNATCVVSPYHVHLADICPAREYPGALVFNLVHGDDVLRLFEDGYLDCVAWLLAGSPSRFKERQGLHCQTGMSFNALLLQGWRTFKDIAFSGRRKVQHDLKTH